MHAIARRLPAIVALAVAAIVAIVASGLLVRLIEARSLSDVRAVLLLSGHDWARVSVDGLQVRLAGTAPSEAMRFRALTAAGTMVEPTRVIDQMTVAERELAPPRFSIEILRNEGEVSLIGLVPKSADHALLLETIRQVGGVTEVTDLLDTAEHPLPEGWQRAVDFGLVALAALPRSKISIAADLVRVSAISESAEAQRRLQAELARKTPEDLRVAIEISAPRPAITPFTLRFVLDPAGRARFDACSADTEAARDAIVRAAVAAGLTGKANCVIGLGAPSPRWGEAAAMAISAVKEMGGGTVTLSDADVSLVAPAVIDKAAFETAVGTLEQRLPEAFSLHAVLTEAPEAGDAAADNGIPEFVAVLESGGLLKMRGRVANEREQAVIANFARAMFGAGEVTDATRLDASVPDGWSVRVLAALQTLRSLDSGGVTVRPDALQVQGRTGLPDASAEIARLLSSELGDGAVFDIDVTYDEKLDPVLGLPTADECVAEINAAIAGSKITFAPGSADIEQGAGATLDAIAALMKNCADYPMEIGGHTDSQGREQMNQQLSQSRAEAVIEALLQRRVLTGNLTARGYGEAQPIADNGTEEGREANRRIEFRRVLSEEEAAAQAEAAEAAAEGGGETDAGAGDAGAADTGSGDAAETDAGADDAGAADAGSGDAAATDGGQGGE